jgi:hypothetical protein
MADEALLREVNSDVWHAFTSAYAARDATAFLAVHAPDLIRAGGEERLFYGRFHTFARKEEGRWRIAVDYDSDEGGTIDDAAFAAGTEMDDVAAFAD